MRALAVKLGVFVTAAAVMSALFINFCDLVFRCGCGFLWTTAAAHCNIHHPQGRHCPWCAHGETGYALAYAAILIPQALASFWPGSRRWYLRLGAALAAFPLAGGLVALAFGLYDGYWNQ
jgi:hypothetical protein